MKAKQAKLSGAINEVQIARASVKHYITEACNGCEALKTDALNHLSSMFDGIEGYLTTIMHTDLVRRL